MINYGFEGSYDFQGKRHPFTGHLQLKDTEFFEGEFLDESSRVRIQPIVGRVREAEGRLVMEFLKDPGADSGLAKIQYQLTMPSSGSLEGDYVGAWRVAVDPKECGQVGIGYDETGEAVAIWIPEKETGNSARLRLIEER